MSRKLKIYNCYAVDEFTEEKRFLGPGFSAYNGDDLDLIFAEQLTEDEELVVEEA